MGIDLLRQQAKWKEGLMDIRHHISSLTQQGFSSSNMKPWMAHWDRQLYKVCLLVTRANSTAKIVTTYTHWFL